MGEMTQNKEGWKGKILSGLFWRFLEQISYQGIQLIFSLFLLRILDTEEVGAVSVISIFITIANTFIQSGFSYLGFVRRNLPPVLRHKPFCGGVLSSPGFRVSFTTNGHFALSRSGNFHPNGLCRKGFAVSPDFSGQLLFLPLFRSAGSIFSLSGLWLLCHGISADFLLLFYHADIILMPSLETKAFISTFLFISFISFWLENPFFRTTGSDLAKYLWSCHRKTLQGRGTGTL